MTQHTVIYKNFVQSNWPAWRLNCANTTACYWTQFWTSFIHVSVLQPMCWMFILMLPFHLVGLKNEDCPRCFYSKIFHTSTYLVTYIVWCNPLDFTIPTKFCDCMNNKPLFVWYYKLFTSCFIGPNIFLNTLFSNSCVYSSKAYQKTSDQTVVLYILRILKAYILITFFTINDKVSRMVQSYGHLNWRTLISFYVGTRKGSGQRLWTLPAKPLGVGNMYGCYQVHTVTQLLMHTELNISYQMLIQNYIFHSSCSMVGITVTV